jgi:hypothetical protein
VIVIHDNDVVIPRQVFAVIGEQILTASVGESPSVHPDHDRALTGAVYFRSPEIDTQAVFARYHDGRAAMNQELIFVVASQVFAIHIEVC